MIDRRGVAASANNSAMEKSIRMEPAPHPPSVFNAPMIAAERADAGKPDTSLVQA